MAEFIRDHPPTPPPPWDAVLPQIPSDYSKYGYDKVQITRHAHDWACEQCLHDEALRRHLCKPIAIGDADACFLCGNETSPRVQVEDLFVYVYRCLRLEYDDPEVEGHLFVDKENGWYHGVSQLDTYDVLAEAGDPFGDGSTLNDLFAESVQHDWYELESEVGTVDERHLWSWQSFEERLIAGPRFLFAADVAEMGEVSADDLFYFLSTLATNLGSDIVKQAPAGLPLIRVRADDERSFVGDHEQLGSPPPAKAQPQRMSAAGVSCFYAAEDEKTAVAEVQPSPDAIVSAGKWLTTSPLAFVDLAGDFKLPSLFDYGHATKRPYYLFLKAFLKHITRPHEEEIDGEMQNLALGDANFYLGTQVLSEFFRYSLGHPYDSQGVDAVRYPSSQRQGGVNWVLFGRPEHGEDSTIECAESWLIDGASDLGGVRVPRRG